MQHCSYKLFLFFRKTRLPLNMNENIHPEEPYHQKNVIFSSPITAFVYKSGIFHTLEHINRNFKIINKNELLIWRHA